MESKPKPPVKKTNTNQIEDSPNMQSPDVRVLKPTKDVKLILKAMENKQ